MKQPLAQPSTQTGVWATHVHGRFQFNKKSEIYGPHVKPVTMPMQRHVGFTPTKADHILSSAMCATCHTVITECFDKQGTATHAHLHEQVPYLEWRNSSFNDEVDSNQATARSCQSCHVPQTDIDGHAISARLAHNPGGRDFPFLNPRKPYALRRAWLEIVVHDNQGKIVFQSGCVNKSGQICDEQGRPNATESAGGPTQPHFDTISNSEQSQIYETFMQNTDDNLTFALLRGSQFKKDNRLLPQGWSNQHAHAVATKPIGIENDANFLAGTDTIDYELKLPSGRYKIEMRLLFQSLSSCYVAELLEVDTPEVKSFAGFYKKANLAPEVIATETLIWNLQ